MLHLYALVPHPAGVPSRGGIDGLPLRVVSVGDRIDAVVSERPGGSPTAAESAIFEHAQVVEALTASNDAVLPARFGNSLGDEKELRRQLEGRLEEIVAACDRVRGCAEVGLRVLPTNGAG